MMRVVIITILMGINHQKINSYLIMRCHYLKWVTSQEVLIKYQ